MLAFADGGGARGHQHALRLRQVGGRVERSPELRGHVRGGRRPRRDGWMECVAMRHQHAALGAQCACFAALGIMVSLDAQACDAHGSEARAQLRERVVPAGAQFGRRRLGRIAVEDHLGGAFERRQQRFRSGCCRESQVQIGKDDDHALSVR
jgi:hypothetical protein